MQGAGCPLSSSVPFPPRFTAQKKSQASPGPGQENEASPVLWVRRQSEAGRIVRCQPAADRWEACRTENVFRFLRNRLSLIPPGKVTEEQ